MNRLAVDPTPKNYVCQSVLDVQERDDDQPSMNERSIKTIYTHVKALFYMPEHAERISIVVCN